MIPLVDLGAQYRSIKPEIDAAIGRVLDNTSFILGKEVSAFEEEFAAACDTKYCVGVASGTAALHLALRAAGIGPGDEVITTPHTFIATAEAVLHCGATPVFIDIDPTTFNLDPGQLEAAISPHTKAILPVHLYGQPADMAPIEEIALRHGLKTIQDAAQAHGGTYRGIAAGSLGEAGCFSFYPGKNLGAYGDGGAVVTNDPEMALRVRVARDHGREDKYTHSEVGYGERLDALQAAILSVKLKHLTEWVEARRRAAALYTEMLTAFPVVTPRFPPSIGHAFHLYVIRVGGRDAVLERMQAAGIGCGIHYPVPLHLQPALNFLGYKSGDFPETERAAAEVLSLPLYPEITQEQVETVVQALQDALRSVPGTSPSPRTLASR